jgi:hypothetical protein
VVAPGLRDPLGDLAHLAADGRGLETVGVALTVGSSLTRRGLQRSLALDPHGMTHQCGESGRHGGRAVLDEKVGEIVEHRPSFSVGHCGILLGGVRHIEESLDDPSLQNWRPVTACPGLASFDSSMPMPVSYRRDCNQLFFSDKRRSYSLTEVDRPAFGSRSRLPGRRVRSAGSAAGGPSWRRRSRGTSGDTCRRSCPRLRGAAAASSSCVGGCPRIGSTGIARHVGP